MIIVAVVLSISLPWLSAELGFHFPGDVFMGEGIIPEKDGTLIAAVHLGHHHGEDGALLLITAPASLASSWRREACVSRSRRISG